MIEFSITLFYSVTAIVYQMLVALSKAGVGCFVGDNLVGALAYADDIVLLAPTASLWLIMLATCDKYAEENSIAFNASKSKCLVVLPRNS